MKRAGVINLTLSSCSKTSINLRNWVVLEKLKPTLRINKVSTIYVVQKTHRKDTLQCSLQPTTRHCLKPCQSISPSPTLFCIINFVIASPLLRHDSVKTVHFSSPLCVLNAQFIASVQVFKSCHIHNKLFVSVTGLKPFATQSWQAIPYRCSRLVVNII